MKRFYSLACVTFVIFSFAFMVCSCRDGGDLTTKAHQWKPKLLGTSKKLTDIFILDVSHAWAVGLGGTIICYDGTSWSEPIEPNPKTTRDLHSVVAFSADDVWALGYYVMVHFDGNTWSTYTPDEVDNLKHNIIGATVIPKTDNCTNATPHQGWAVTNGSNYYKYDGSKEDPAERWEYVSYGKQTDRNGISGNCEGQIWSVGNYSKIHTWSQDGGWKECEPFFGPFTKPFNGVSVCKSQEKGKRKYVLVVGRKNLVYHSTNGKTFEEFDSGSNDKKLNDVVYLNESNAWAVGDKGTILFSGTPPNYWEPQTWDTELAGGTLPDLFAVAALAVDAEPVWAVAVGANGTLLEYSPSQ